MSDPSPPADGTVTYFSTEDPDVLEAYVWSAADRAWLYKGQVRRAEVVAATARPPATAALRATADASAPLSRRPKA